MLKVIVHSKMKILSLITHPHVVPNPLDLRSSSEHKLRSFWWNPRDIWPCIDSKTTNMFKAQKGSKDIIKKVNVSLELREHQSLTCIHKCTTTHVCGAADAGVLKYNPDAMQMQCNAVFTCRWMHMHALWYSHEHVLKTDMEENINCWKKLLFLFCLHTKSILVASNN